MEMIQAVVARLAGNSFLIKGWALTLTGAFLGFGVDKNDWGLAAMAFVPILVFGALDTYYLWAERRFRVHHDRVRAKDASVEPFSMSPPKDGGVESWLKTLTRPTVWGFYHPWSQRPSSSSRSSALADVHPVDWQDSRIRSATPFRSTPGSPRFDGQISPNSSPR